MESIYVKTGGAKRSRNDGEGKDGLEAVKKLASHQDEVQNHGRKTVKAVNQWKKCYEMWKMKECDWIVTVIGEAPAVMLSSKELYKHMQINQVSYCNNQKSQATRAIPCNSLTFFGNQSISSHDGLRELKILLKDGLSYIAFRGKRSVESYKSPIGIASHPVVNALCRGFLSCAANTEAKDAMSKLLDCIIDRLSLDTCTPYALSMGHASKSSRYGADVMLEVVPDMPGSSESTRDRVTTSKTLVPDVVICSDRNGLDKPPVYYMLVEVKAGTTLPKTKTQLEIQMLAQLHNVEKVYGIYFCAGQAELIRASLSSRSVLTAREIQIEKVAVYDFFDGTNVEDELLPFDTNTFVDFVDAVAFAIIDMHELVCKA